MFPKIFLNEKVLLIVILINTAIIFMMEWGFTGTLISLMDICCTLFFLVEMIYKNIHMGVKKYWTSPIEVIDAILVILSLPTVVEFFFSVELGDLSFLLILRVFRILRMFRLTHVFPDFDIIVRNFRLALKNSYAFLLIIFIFIIVFALINCNLFKQAAPEYFQTPLDAVYSTFRLFTIEGWYDIPDSVAKGMGSPFWGHFIKIFFSAQLFLGGIIGMSLINSIFVDAMVSDNNDELKAEVLELKKMLQDIQKKLDEK